ncbi:protein of unknown function (plasmid) [Agrobacterium pusense]|uniref:Uncharacterized protein n=1 Tax=Agrobacterium pusense TaxID=648995 RepID=U4QHG4_9HYPH|nr:protein of unknown function [Agrobacterium pusense]
MARVQHENLKNSVTPLIYPRYPRFGARHEGSAVKILVIPTSLNPFRIFVFANTRIVFLNLVVLDSFARPEQTMNK